MGKASATGSFQLFIGVAVSTIIMAIGTLILAKLMLQAEYGLYTIATIPAITINLFRDWGVNSAITKYVASYRATNSKENIRNVIVAGSIFECATGLALSFLSFILAGFIASTIFHRPESTFLISVVSISIFSGSLLTVAQSCFIGFERMGLSSFTIICQAVVKTIIGPLLVLLGYGTLGAVLGYTLSFLAAGIIGMTVLYFGLLKSLPKSDKNKSTILDTLRAMLKFGVPFSVYSILGGIVTQFYSFVMVFFIVDTAMIGNYQLSLSFTVLLTFITTPISTVLFPAFSKLNPQNERKLLKSIFASSVKYSTLLLVPATLGMMVLSKPIIATLFQEKYPSAPFFLAVAVAGNLLVAIGNLSLSGLLAGLGETKMLMKLSIPTLLISLPLAFVLVPTFGITGVILGPLLSALPSLFLGLRWAWNHYEVKADLGSSARIIAASTIATIITYFFLSLFSAFEWIRLVTGAIIFFTVYILSAPLVGAITQSDTKNLRDMFSGFVGISRIFNTLLVLIEKVTTLHSAEEANSS